MKFRIAIQNNGKLTKDSMRILNTIGYDFEVTERKVYSIDRNGSNSEILFVRHGDIPFLIKNGYADYGIIGTHDNLECEKEIFPLRKLGFGRCKLVLAVKKNSTISSVEELNGKKIATTFPEYTKLFFEKHNVKVEIIKLSGSIEIAPYLQIADAVVDLAQTGSSLIINDLKIVTEILETEAQLVCKTKNENSELTKQLLRRIDSVVDQKLYKYIIFNITKDSYNKFKLEIPSQQSPTINNLADDKWISVAIVVKSEMLWNYIDLIKNHNGKDIIIQDLTMYIP